MRTPAIGIDFGTTNSSVARILPDGGAVLARFDTGSGMTESFRSLVYLELVEEGRAKRVKSWTGPAGIERYLAAETKGRLIQSLKSFLSARSLLSTEVFGRRMRLEELIARILRELRESASRQFGFDLRTAVVGRPVRFVGAETEDDNAFAEQRLRDSLERAGFEGITFELEPVAAAHYYESGLDHDELILIGDFGGGTSDFSLLHVGPSVLRRGRRAEDFLGNSGLGLAGDAFDAKLVRHLVSPELGRGSEAESLGKVLPAVPNWVYAKLERWHHLSLLRTGAVMTMLRSSLATAYEPEKIEALIHLVNEDLGYHLHRSVQKVKCDLSAHPEATFRFADGGIEIEAVVRREEFEEWIAEELGQIEGCVDGLLRTAGVARGDVDRVFLTGGSSFVPAVRRIFETRFGAERIRAGNEFTSVAQGLARKAEEGSQGPGGN
jgi:hypothetical chaperone protein